MLHIDDLNCFSGVAPGNIVANLVAGGIAEAGAQQAGTCVPFWKLKFSL